MIIHSGTDMNNVTAKKDRIDKINEENKGRKKANVLLLKYVL